MDWGKATDKEIRTFLLDLWDREGIDLYKKAGFWMDKDAVTRLGALQGVARIMDILLNAIEAGRLESLTEGIKRRRNR